jgi:hypothetical protein
MHFKVYVFNKFVFAVYLDQMDRFST